MTEKELAPAVARVLSKFDGVRPTRDGWDARCPCPDHNASSGKPGDHNPSLRITIGHDGRILIKCRVSCKTAEVLETVGLQWDDLFVPQSDERVEPLVPQRDVSSQQDMQVAHSAYDSLLSRLTLNAHHEQDLHKRGMSTDHIQLGQYRSLRNTERGRVARTVFQEIGSDLLNVPGFIKGEFGITLAGTSTGLLIPVRDSASRIQAVKIRCASDPRYQYLSSSETGNSSGNPVHVPVGVAGPVETVRVTEGELKADICSWLAKTPTIGVPGVGQWKLAFPVLQELEVRRVIIAFDAPDLRSKPSVFKAARDFWLALKDEGYEVEVEDWCEHP